MRQTPFQTSILFIMKIIVMVPFSSVRTDCFQALINLKLFTQIFPPRSWSPNYSLKFY